MLDIAALICILITFHLHFSTMFQNKNILKLYPKLYVPLEILQENNSSIDKNIMLFEHENAAISRFCNSISMVIEKIF